MAELGIHPLVMAALRRDLGEAEFKLRRLESEMNTVPAGARSTMGTLRLAKRVKELQRVCESWQRVVQLGATVKES